MRRCVAGLVALLLSATACSAERPVLEESAAREVTAEASTTTVVTVPGEVLPLRLAVGDSWTGDPADASPASVADRVVADLLFEGLAQIDRTGEPIPALADEWFVSEDRLTWTFVLPETLVDGAGLPIVARDIKLSLERVAARGAADQGALALEPVVGWRDFVEGRAGGLAGVSVTDATTLVIRLDTPYELLPAVLASPAFGVTGEVDGELRTTGAYRYGADAETLEAVDVEAAVAEIELVADAGADVVTDGRADWAVLAADDRSDEIDGDVIRQPLAIEAGLVARQPAADARRGTLGALSPLLLAGSLDSMTARNSTSAEPPAVPAAIVVDYPAGSLAPLGEAVVAQLQSAGSSVVGIASTPDEFAARVASGEATVFPVVVASGVGVEHGLLRLATPGGSDDTFGDASAARTELADAIRAETDREQRDVLLAALEQQLIDDGFYLPVGRYEVRVALSRRADGIRHRVDGTLDLSEVAVS